MNKEKIAILTDSGCDVPLDLIEKYDIKVLSLKIIYDNEVYSDGIDIQAETIYKNFPTKIPKTSTPNTQEVNDMVVKIKEQGYEKIIAICISSGLSATHNTVKVALDEIHDMETFVFDSKNISIGAGIFAIWAAKKIEDGLGFEEITQALQKKTFDSKLFYYMDTLEYLKIGGRIGNVTGFVGKLLDLKPIITCNEKGIYYNAAMARGKVNGIKKLFNIVDKYKDRKNLWICLLHGDAADMADKIRPQLMAIFNNGKLVVDKQINASLAIHTGPGLIGIGVFWGDM